MQEPVIRSADADAINVNVEQAGRRLGVSAVTVRRLIARGELGSVTIGRRRLVPVEAISAYQASLRRAS